jgi:hypothetical protein
VTRRVYADLERGIFWTWRPRRIILDCSMVIWYWLRWFGSVWLIPHSRTEHITTLMSIGATREQAEETVPANIVGER